MATARLGAVVAATPARLWLAEYPRLVDLSASASPLTHGRAIAVSEFLNDPALFHARQVACAPKELSPPREEPSDPVKPNESCLSVIDSALKGNPSSGELWLLRAQVLMQARGISPEVYDAIHSSYLTTPREGWIAAERVLMGLRLYPLLSGDLQEQVISDLRIVLNNPGLAEPLINAYPNDMALRRASTEAMQALPPDLLNRFVNFVKDLGL